MRSSGTDGRTQCLTAVQCHRFNWPLRTCRDGNFGRGSAGYAPTRTASCRNASSKTSHPTNASGCWLPQTSGDSSTKMTSDRSPCPSTTPWPDKTQDIVFRVEGGAKRTAMQQPMLAFEVDHVDEDRKFGWSVLVRGVGAEVDPERVPALLQAVDGHFPTPWVAGIHNVWLQFVSHTVIGRRLGAERSTYSTTI